MLPIDDRVVMISGASRGIGAAIARQLLDDGYRVSLGVRNPASAPFTDAGNCCIVGYDAADRDAGERWVAATAERFGQIDALVNNVGISRKFSIDEGSEDALDEMWDVNVKAPIRVIRAALPYLRQCGAGRVIQIASLAGKRIARNNHGYAMTKFAAVALAQSTRHLGWEDGIRATALCPGMVNTDMTSWFKDADRSTLTQPEDVAEIVACLLRLPNSASIAELLVNFRLEAMF